MSEYFSPGVGVVTPSTTETDTAGTGVHNIISYNDIDLPMVKFDNLLMILLMQSV